MCANAIANHSSQAAKSFDGFLNGFIFLDDRVHGVLFEIHFLSERQNLDRFRARYDHDTVSVGRDYVTRPHLDAVTRHWNIGPGKAVMTDRGRWNNAGCVHRKTYFAQLPDVTPAALDHRAGIAARRHSRTHQATHAGDVSSILNHHDPYRMLRALIDGGQHAAQRSRVLVALVLAQLHGEREPGEFGGENGLHLVRQVHLPARELLECIGYGCHLNVTITVEQSFVFIQLRTDGGLRQKAQTEFPNRPDEKNPHSRNQT